MLHRLDLRGVTELEGRLPRPQIDRAPPVEVVRAILDDVRARGDEAVRAHTARFDGVELERIEVPAADLEAALGATDAAVIEALEAAAGAIRSFHESQLVEPRRHTHNGVGIDSVRRPVDRAGCYVPGGRAAYPSTVLMTAVPARVAGVPEVVLCVPPGPDGRVATVTLAAAALAGVDTVFAVGGAQAIGALAYGTETIAPVDTIAGPGNIYVATAKREVSGRVGVPSAFAGPSEVVVVADETAPVDGAAIDLIVQAEHGPDGLAWLITWDAGVADAVSARVADLLEQAPRRREIEATLAAGGYAVVVDDPEQAMAVANRIAPEHLELITRRPESLVPLVRHAGAVFCGPWAPASIGDYVAGPSHVLPTFGSARFGSALTVDDFQKHLHVVHVDEEAFCRVGTWVETLATAEGLDAHAESIRLRRATVEGSGGVT